MRRFEYGRIQSLSWDMDMLSLIAGIYRANGKEEVLLSQSPRCWSLLWSWQRCRVRRLRMRLKGL